MPGQVLEYFINVTRRSLGNFLINLLLGVSILLLIRSLPRNQSLGLDRGGLYSMLPTRHNLLNSRYPLRASNLIAFGVDVVSLHRVAYMLC